MGRIIFIVQQLSQPRCIKRIEDVISSNFDYKVYGFKNGLYEDNIRNLKFEIAEARIIDKKTKKRIKIFEYYKLVKYVLRNAGKNDLIYCFGFELGAICALINMKNKFVYEEADVSASRFSNHFIKKVLIKLDKWTIKRACLTVFTSRGFANYLFKNNHPYQNKTIFLENKLHPLFSTVARPSPAVPQNDSITFGFIGLIRYPNTILRFAKVVANHFPQHKFYFFGDTEGDFINKNEWCNYKNIKFFGKFQNPDDLESIYTKIDISIACYDTRSDNVKIAEPNKLYESIFFNKPIVVSSNTFLAKRVKEFNSGYTIDASTDKSIIEFIQSINSDSINTFIQSISTVPKKELISSKDELIERLSKLVLQT